MNKYRKALKNYTTKANPEGILKEIENILLDFGATGIIWEYDADRNVSAILFKILISNETRVINIPLLVGKTKGVLEKQKVIPKRNNWNKDYESQMKKDWEHAYRVTLANIREWLDAQMAIYTTEMFEFPQIFLPYMQTADGRTVYDLIKEKQFTIGNN